MSGRVLRVLLVEDSAADSELIENALKGAGLPATVERVETEPAFAAAVERFAPDVVLSDQGVGQVSTGGVLSAIRALRPGTPLIVVTGALREESAVASLRAGAENLVLKTNLGRLGPAIEAALRVREPLERLSRRQQEVLRLIAEGQTSPAIARGLQLSVKTVETHRAELMRRLGIHDVVGLVRYAVRVGLVPPEA